MTKSININGIDVEIQRKKIRNLHLHVRPDGRVYVSAPMRISEKEIVRFVRTNVHWVEEQKLKYEQKPGKEYYLERKPQLEEQLALLLPKWEQLTGLKCQSWHTRYMTSRWGSCIPSKGRICFNLQLADKPADCLEYVILHELLHLIHPGHGADFKADLDRYMPDWRVRQRILK